MSVIEIEHLTKDYGHGRGVFDVSACVERGECFGFLGPNGAGKSTAIRHLMGFSRPEQGSCRILGQDTWNHAAALQQAVGYLPGEIALPENLTGVQFLQMMQQMRGKDCREYLRELLARFELDPQISVKAMSLGVKRKLAVVTAFMHDPEILILDEPTSGLDPMMQQAFIDFVLGEKKRGKTIFLSSHIFHEVDASCDRIAIIKDGRIVSEADPKQLKKDSDRIYRFLFKNKEELGDFLQRNYHFTSVNSSRRSVRVCVKNEQVQQLFSDISRYDIEDFTEIPFTLEDYFLHFYKEDKTFEGVE